MTKKEKETHRIITTKSKQMIISRDSGLEPGTVNVDSGMEHKLQRLTIGIQNNEDGSVEAKEYNKYKLQTRMEYEDLMMEFEFRCRRAAMMNYYEASGYDKYVYRIEVAIALLGTISVSSVAAWFFQSDASSLTSFKSFSKLGLLGGLGVTCACILHFIGKGSSRLLPTMSNRAHTFIEAGAAWQRLAQKTRSYRIRLDNPTMDVPEFAAWYEGLIDDREKLCVMASIPQATYEKFNDPSTVFKIMKQRRELFLKFLQLEATSVDDLVDGSGIFRAKKTA